MARDFIMLMRRLSECMNGVLIQMRMSPRGSEFEYLVPSWHCLGKLGGMALLEEVTEGRTGKLPNVLRTGSLHPACRSRCETPAWHCSHHACCFPDMPLISPGTANPEKHSFYKFTSSYSFFFLSQQQKVTNSSMDCFGVTFDNVSLKQCKLIFQTRGRVSVFILQLLIFQGHLVYVFEIDCVLCLKVTVVEINLPSHISLIDFC